MAILKSFVGMKVIDGFKGKVDFYYYMGVAVARKWPRSQGKSQTPASVAAQPAFAYCAQIYSTISPFVYETYHQVAEAYGLHAKDWFTRAYYGKLYRYPT